MKHLLFLVFFVVSFVSFSQNDLLDSHFKDADSLYREDQFYIGLGINILSDLPSGMRQSGLSGGFHLGFIRDLPLNKKRNIGLGIGLGLALDTYSQNLFIGETDQGSTIFEIIRSDLDYSTNRFATQVVEMPFHFRWRTSDVGSSKSFWRIYGGVNVGYMYYFHSTFKQDNNEVEQTKLDELNRLRWALYLSFGKSKINFFLNYSLNPFFDGTLDGSEIPINVTVFKAGLVFYIL